MVFRGKISCFWLILMIFGWFGGYYGVISGKSGQKMGDFFHFQFPSKWVLNDLYGWNTLFWLKKQYYEVLSIWLSARSASTLIKPQAIHVLNFTRANGRWRTLVLYKLKSSWTQLLVNKSLKVKLRPNNNKHVYEFQNDLQLNNWFNFLLNQSHYKK